MKKENNDLSYLANTNNELYKELKNVIRNNDNNDVTKKRYFENKVQFLLWKLVEDINTSKILPRHFIKIQFAKRYSFCDKNPVSLTNF